MFKNVTIFETAQRKELVKVKCAVNETQSVFWNLADRATVSMFRTLSTPDLHICSLNDQVWKEEDGGEQEHDCRPLRLGGDHRGGALRCRQARQVPSVGWTFRFTDNNNNHSLRHVFTGEKVAVKVIDKLKLDQATRMQMLQVEFLKEKFGNMMRNIVGRGNVAELLMTCFANWRDFYDTLLFLHAIIRSIYDLVDLLGLYRLTN